VQRVSDIIGEISAAATEQSAGIGQVNGAIGQLDQMTQQNAALVEQSAAAADSLKDQAVRLAGVVSTFRLGEADQQAARAPSAPRPVDVAKAAIQHARVQSKPLPTGAGSADDWESF
jgi:methyl-accepting chemotaxis protein